MLKFYRNFVGILSLGRQTFRRTQSSFQCLNNLPALMQMHQLRSKCVGGVCYLPKRVPICHNSSSSGSGKDVNIPIVKYEEIKNLPKHPEKLLIDVRQPEELKETGQIPTSINIPLDVVKQELSDALSADKFKAKYGREKPTECTEIIFHCKSGKRSLAAATEARALGYANVRNYEGSWLDWAEHEGLPK